MKDLKTKVLSQIGRQGRLHTCPRYCLWRWLWLQGHFHIQKTGQWRSKKVQVWWRFSRKRIPRQELHNPCKKCCFWIRQRIQPNWWDIQKEPSSNLKVYDWLPNRKINTSTNQDPFFRTTSRHVSFLRPKLIRNQRVLWSKTVTSFWIKLNFLFSKTRGPSSRHPFSSLFEKKDRIFPLQTDQFRHTNSKP